MLPVAAQPSWFDRWCEWRDHLLASTRFRRWAAAFPLTRPIARRRARRLFDLCAGFVYSQILLACVRLRLFDVLLEGPKTLAELSQRLSLGADSTARLLGAARSLGLVTPRSGERFGLGALGAALAGNPGVLAMIEHHAFLYQDLRDPVALLRNNRSDTELARLWPYASAERPASLAADQVAAYSALMSASQPLIAQEVLDAYPLHGHRCLLDVGGGEGAFVAAAAAGTPGLQLILFDLPAVAERARGRFVQAGIAARTRAVGGDFLRDPMPEGADIVTLIRVVHDHDDRRALALLRAAYRALPPGGTLLVAEPLAETPGAEPVGAAYFGFYLLAMGRGQPRTFAALAELLRRAGFTQIRSAPTATPLVTSVVLARRGPV